MCTAAMLYKNVRLFGRNFDFHRSFGETVVLTPRNLPINFRHLDALPHHYAILGMGAVAQGTALYFDAVNEHGLAVAGLNFPNCAVYSDSLCEGKHNVASFEVICWVLSQCSSVKEAVKLIKNVNITSEAFGEAYPVTPLHFMISDGKDAVVLEALKDGVKVYKNGTGVLTNTPSFDIQEENFKSARGKITLPRAEGLPGDYSSESRFIRAAYVREKMQSDLAFPDLQSFFHLLASVSVPAGCVKGEDGELHYTKYASCMNCEKLEYHYKRYDDVFLRSITPAEYELDLSMLITYD